MLQLVLMNRESDFMRLEPYKLDLEYWVEKIKSSTFNRRNNSTITLFWITTIMFQNVINPSTILFEFLPNKCMCDKFCCSRMLFIFRYFKFCVVIRRRKLKHTMWGRIMQIMQPVLSNTKGCNKMVTVKIKIMIFQPSVRLHYLVI